MSESTKREKGKRRGTGARGKGRVITARKKERVGEGKPGRRDSQVAKGVSQEGWGI